MSQRKCFFVSLFLFFLLLFSSVSGAGEKQILVTGFEPFGKEKINPLYEAVKALPDTIEGWKIRKLEVPVTWDHTKGKSSVKVIIDAIEQYQPQVLLMSGQHGGFSKLAIEKRGRNSQAKFKDNNNIAGSGGTDPVLLKTDPNARMLYRTTTPNEKIVDAIQNAGVEAFLNDDPGNYICEHVIYRIGHYLETNDLKYSPPILYGFIHVPYLPSQMKGKKNAHSMPLENIVKGYEAAIKAIIADFEVAQ